MKKKGKKMIMVLLIMGLSISATGCRIITQRRESDLFWNVQKRNG